MNYFLPGSMIPFSTASLYSLARSFSSLCQARAAQSSAKDFPDPVGDSSRAFFDCCSDRTIWFIMAT